MLAPMAYFAVDPDQTVPRTAVRFGSTLFATKTSYRQSNVANTVQAASRKVVRYGSRLFATKTAYGSPSYVREMKPMLTSTANISAQTNIWVPAQTAPRRAGLSIIWVHTVCYKDWSGIN